jgi:hypothetical protein
MKISRLTFSFAALLICSARADLTIVQNVEGGGATNVMTIKIRGDKARLEPTPEVTTIIDSRTGEIVNLMNSQKKFVRISAERAREAAEMALKADSKLPTQLKAQLKPTGKKEKILGFEAEEYVCETPSFKATYWISTKYPDSQKIVQQMHAMTPESWNINGKGLPDYRDFPGLPLRSHMTLAGKEVRSTLVSVKQDPLSDAEFVPPKDFGEMTMPKLDVLPGHKSKAQSPAPSPGR